MFVQYDPTVPNPITLPVTTSSEPDGAFVINNALGVTDKRQSAAVFHNNNN